MQKCSAKRHKATVGAEVLFGWESDVHFGLNGPSFGGNFSSKVQRMFENFMQSVCGLKLFEF